MSAVTALIAKALGRDIEVGEFAEVPVHMVMGHDVSAPLAVKAFRELRAPIWNPDRVAIIFDHFVPASTAHAASEQKMLRHWVKEQKIKNFFDVNYGVCHQVLLENQLVKPGEILAGADSHTCSSGAVGCLGIGIGSTELAAAMVTGTVWMKVPETIAVNLQGNIRPPMAAKDAALFLLGRLGEHLTDYRIIEFSGAGARSLNLAERVTMCNLMAEAGAKGALFTDLLPADMAADQKGAALELNINLSTLEPMIALPHSPDKVIPIHRLSEKISIDQAYLGSCTNGRLEDLAAAARILKGKKTASATRLIVAPASRRVLTEALRQGLISTLLDAGALLAPTACGACFGGHIGLLGEGETCLSSTNRNFKGRMGASGSLVYLASPAAVAASAVHGCITDPREEW
jgi:3-isopropylmalate dehydratase large subunit